MRTDLTHLPSTLETVEALENLLSRPTPEVVQAVRSLDGDIMVLGAGGKMGPSLATMAQRAVRLAQVDKRIVAVSRFGDPAVAEGLERVGIETVCCDLMADGALDALPDAANVIHMVGHKFGTTGSEALTWAVNAYLPGRVAQRFHKSRIVVFSSGNVYPLTSVIEGNCTEAMRPAPVGEYAQSVLGRERIFTFFAERHAVQSVLLRLNYAVEMRYGVLLDIAHKVWVGDPIDVRMGHVNVIWQGDANAYALRALALARVPPYVLNVTGPETLSVRSVAQRFGELLGRIPVFHGTEAPDALLSNAQHAFSLMGYPQVTTGKVIEWVAQWVVAGGPVHAKPTKFQVRDGRF